jgi:hypothetical protein
LAKQNTLIHAKEKLLPVYTLSTAVHGLYYQQAVQPRQEIFKGRTAAGLFAAEKYFGKKAPRPLLVYVEGQNGLLF